MQNLTAITIAAALACAACGPEPGTDGPSSEESTSEGMDGGSSGTTTTGGPTRTSATSTDEGSSGTTEGGGDLTQPPGTEDSSTGTSTGPDPDTGDTETDTGVICVYDAAQDTCLCDGVYSLMCEECAPPLGCWPKGCFLDPLVGFCVCGQALGVAEGVFCGCEILAGPPAICMCDNREYPLSYCDPWS